MDLSPNDIRSYEFPNQMRGYDKDEVDNFLDQVAAVLEASKQENLRLSMELDSLKGQLAGLKQFEDTIKSAAIDARRNADTTVANAKQEAEALLAKAKEEAAHIIEARTKDAADIENQITKLGLTRKSYLSKIRNLIAAHMEMVDEIDAGDIPDSAPGDALTITNSTDVTTERRETVASQPNHEPMFTEESEDEVDDSVESETAEADVAEDLKEAIRSEGDEAQPEPEQPIDPELAAALESYKKTAAQQADNEAGVGRTAETSATKPGFVETTARAEDIPDGFIAKEEDLGEDSATDRVTVEASKASSNVEPNSLDIDGSKPNPLEPDKLADELDEVAARFEKEMEKAEQN